MGEKSQSIQETEVENVKKNIMLFHSNKEPDKTKADRTWLGVWKQQSSEFQVPSLPPHS